MTKATIGNIELRSSTKNKEKSYFVRGYASFKGLDTYNTQLSKNCFESLAKGLKANSIRVGAEHSNTLGDKLLNNLNIIKEQYVTEGRNTQSIDEAIMFASKKKLPLGKPRQVLVDENGVQVEVELNSHMRDVDPEYFDAVVKMLEDSFLDGFSIEFKNAKKHDEYNEAGQRVTIIDDLDVTGLEFVSGAANSNAKITDVFVRMAGFEDKEDKMVEEKVETVSKEEHDKVVKELGDMKKALSDLTVKKDDSIKKTQGELDEKTTELTAAKEEQKTLLGEMSEVKEYLKQIATEGKLNSAKGVVKQEDKYGKPLEENKGKSAKEEIEKLSLAELAQKIYS